MMTKTVTVDADALRRILQALIGPGYLIRELQAIRSLGNSPINKLMEQYKEQISQTESP